MQRPARGYSSVGQPSSSSSDRPRSLLATRDGYRIGHPTVQSHDRRRLRDGSISTRGYFDGLDNEEATKSMKQAGKADYDGNDDDDMAGSNRGQEHEEQESQMQLVTRPEGELDPEARRKHDLRIVWRDRKWDHIFDLYNSYDSTTTDWKLLAGTKLSTGQKDVISDYYKVLRSVSVQDVSAITKRLHLANFFVSHCAHVDEFRQGDNIQNAHKKVNKFLFSFFNDELKISLEFQKESWIWLWPCSNRRGSADSRDWQGYCTPTGYELRSPVDLLTLSTQDFRACLASYPDLNIMDAFKAIQTHKRTADPDTIKAGKIHQAAERESRALEREAEIRLSKAIQDPPTEEEEFAVDETETLEEPNDHGDLSSVHPESDVLDIVPMQSPKPMGVAPTRSTRTPTVLSPTQAGLRETRVVKRTTLKPHANSQCLFDITPQSLAAFFNQESSARNPGTGFGNMPSPSLARLQQLLGNLSLPNQVADADGLSLNQTAQEIPSRFTELESSPEPRLESEDECVLAAFDTPAPQSVPNAPVISAIDFSPLMDMTPESEPRLSTPSPLELEIQLSNEGNPPITEACESLPVLQDTLCDSSIQVPQSPSPARSSQHATSINIEGDQFSSDIVTETVLADASPEYNNKSFDIIQDANEMLCDVNQFLEGLSDDNALVQKD
ncbi:hypothetical protein B9Z19DRAFT_1129964 [Tuber borchii]|uniref:Uncharacterized protein n=1 Tax=Tuber borchii TaxID=42251 RepID=A0A2T6ZL93_TUBBO|nr:hypothetical protein B9Z19DRAFT_1129964 [Tuber borchii]